MKGGTKAEPIEGEAGRGSESNDPCENRTSLKVERRPFRAEGLQEVKETQ